MEEPKSAGVVALVDCSNDFAALPQEVNQVQQQIITDTVYDYLRQTRKQRKSFAYLATTDLFQQKPKDKFLAPWLSSSWHMHGRLLAQ